MPDAALDERLLQGKILRSAGCSRQTSTILCVLISLGFAVVLSVVLCTHGGGVQSQEPAIIALQGMQPARAQRIMQPAGAWQSIQMPLAKQPTQPANAWQAVQSARFRHFMKPPAAAASEDGTSDKAAAEPVATMAEAQAPPAATQSAAVTLTPSLAAAGKRAASETPDGIASFLTRRFGLKGGLAWLGFLTFGVVSEQVKTRLEEKYALDNTVDIQDKFEQQTPNGIRYTDLKRGGGEAPQAGYFMAANMKVTVVDSVGKLTVLDTSKSGKQLSFIFGKLGGPITKGALEGMLTMRAGGKRILIVPPELAFGEQGAKLPLGVVPPNAEVTYEIELTRVSIPPT